MELKNAINERKSVRGYLDKPVDKETLEKVLTLATRAVSGHNFQPWEISVAAGETLKEFGEANVASFLAGEAGDADHVVSAEPYKGRGKVIGKALFAAMEIGREDADKRQAWSERGFRFFGAPAVIILSVDETMDESFVWLDFGALTQNICLAAKEYGLDTCVEYQAVNYFKNVRKYLNLPENKKPVVGIAIGYEDPAFPANAVISEREPLEVSTNWFGF